MLFGWVPIQWNRCPSRRKTPGLMHRGRTWEDPPRKLLASRKETSEETTPAGVWTFALRTVKRQARDCLGHPVRGAGSRPVPGTRTPGPRLETGRGPEGACSASPSSPLLPPLLFGKKKKKSQACEKSGHRQHPEHPAHQHTLPLDYTLSGTGCFGVSLFLFYYYFSRII